MKEFISPRLLSPLHNRKKIRDQEGLIEHGSIEQLQFDLDDDGTVDDNDVDLDDVEMDEDPKSPKKPSADAADTSSPRRSPTASPSKKSSKNKTKKFGGQSKKINLGLKLPFGKTNDKKKKPPPSSK